MAELILSIRNSLGELSVAANSATQFLQSMNVSRGVIFAANLAIEEIITNTIKYGYDDELAHESSCGLTFPRACCASKSLTTEGNSTRSISPNRPLFPRPKVLR